MEERYGEMDMSFDGYFMGYSIDVYDFWGHILWDPDHFYYCIIADEGGVARDIVVGSSLKGPRYDYTEEEGLLKRIFFIFGISFY